METVPSAHFSITHRSQNVRFFLVGSSECRIGTVRTLFGKIPKRVSRGRNHKNNAVANEPCTFSLLKHEEFCALFFDPTSPKLSPLSVNSLPTLSKLSRLSQSSLTPLRDLSKLSPLSLNSLPTLSKLSRLQKTSKDYTSLFTAGSIPMTRRKRGSRF